MNAPKYKQPLDPKVAHWANCLDEAAREFFEERAAIREFESNEPRQLAELNAQIETQQFLARRNTGA